MSFGSEFVNTAKTPASPIQSAFIEAALSDPALLRSALLRLERWPGIRVTDDGAEVITYKNTDYKVNSEETIEVLEDNFKLSEDARLHPEVNLQAEKVKRKRALVNKEVEVEDKRKRQLVEQGQRDDVSALMKEWETRAKKTANNVQRDLQESLIREIRELLPEPRRINETSGGGGVAGSERWEKTGSNENKLDPTDGSTGSKE